MNVCEYEIVNFMCFLLELWFQILIKWILCTFLWDLILPDFVSTLYISKFYRLPFLLLLIMTLLIFFEKRNETNERVHSLNLKWEWELLNWFELWVYCRNKMEVCDLVVKFSMIIYGMSERRNAGILRGARTHNKIFCMANFTLESLWNGGNSHFDSSNEEWKWKDQNDKVKSKDVSFSLPFSPEKCPFKIQHFTQQPPIHARGSMISFRSFLSFYFTSVSPFYISANPKGARGKCLQLNFHLIFKRLKNKI